MTNDDTDTYNSSEITRAATSSMMDWHEEEGIIIPSAAAPPLSSHNDNSSAMITPPRHSVAVRRFLPTLLQLSSSSSLAALDWLELEDSLAVLLENDADSLKLFQSVHSVGVRDPAVLKSLAYLVSPALLRNQQQQDCNGGNHEDSAEYTDAVSTVAVYLATSVSSVTTPTASLACIRLLVTLRSPVQAGWQLEESVLQDTLAFITNPNSNSSSNDNTSWDNLYEHSDQVLLWELRAICRNEQVAHKEYNKATVQRRGLAAAATITASARMIECGLGKSTNVLSTGLDQTAVVMKRVLEADVETEQSWNPKSQVVTLTYTNAAVRATDSARTATKACAVTVRGASARGLQAAANKFQQEGLAARLVPDEQHLSLLTAAGHVGLASIGAAAVVGDAVFESTAQVCKKTAQVTADVVQHKYGPSAGQLVRDASDTAGNVLRTIAYVATFEGKVLSKAVARDTGKLHVAGQLDRTNSTLVANGAVALADDDDEEEGYVVDMVDQGDLESETGVGLVDIRKIFLSSSRAASLIDKADVKMEGNETDETESMTLCSGDDLVSKNDVRNVQMRPRLTLDASGPDEGGGLQIHERYNGLRNESDKQVVSLNL